MSKLLFFISIGLATALVAEAKDISIEVVETQRDTYLGHHPMNAMYSAKVILPDGSHAALACSLPADNGCGDIEPLTPPEKTPTT